MAGTATTIEEQIALLKNRGMEIEDEKKAAECLLDIGYFRLGFYWFPFEKSYPRKVKRDHNFKDNTKFDYAIKLYYFDFDLRNIFLKYISRIEINFRTTIVYYVSNTYKNNPYWYVDESVIKKEAILSPEYQKALIDMAKESLIKTDKSEHKGRSNPPAWKALEFMSFGTIIKLYENLKNPKLLCEISNVYGMSHPSQFSNYINVVRKLRHYCAHGKVLFDLNLDEAISDGPLGYLGNQKNSLFGIYSVFKYFLGRISSNRVKEMQAELLRAFDRVPYPSVKTIIFNNSGFNIEDI